MLIVAGPRSRAGFAAGGPGFQMRVRSRSSRRLAACLACSTSPPGTRRKPKPALTLPPGAKPLAARARRPCSWPVIGEDEPRAEVRRDLPAPGPPARAYRASRRRGPSLHRLPGLTCICSRPGHMTAAAVSARPPRCPARRPDACCPRPGAASEGMPTTQLGKPADGPAVAGEFVAWFGRRRSASGWAPGEPLAGASLAIVGGTWQVPGRGGVRSPCRRRFLRPDAVLH